MNAMHLYLCGFMGSGKSALGKIISKKLNRPFFDLDDVIEQQQNVTISEIFANHGEEKFRELESRTLQDLSSRNKPSVISLGGGAVVNSENRAIIQSTGKLVYLKTSVSLLVRRLRNSKKRPKLLKKDGSLRNEEELESLITTMLDKREKFYMTADVVVDIREHKPKIVTAGIVYSQIINQYPNLT